MYNTSVVNSLSDVAVEDGVTLKLTPVTANKAEDGATTNGELVFLVNPDEEAWSFKSEFSKAAVLNTAQPLVTPKSSETTFSLPKVRLYTPDNAKNIQPLIDGLRAFTQPTKAGEDPPVLKLTYGELVIPRVYLESADVTIKARLGGSATMAEASLGFILAPEPQKVKQVEPPPSTIKGINTVLGKKTEREQSELYQKLVSALLENKLQVLGNLSVEAKKNLAKVDKAKLAGYTVQLFTEMGFSFTDKGEFVLKPASVVYTAPQVKELTGVDTGAEFKDDGGSIKMVM